MSVFDDWDILPAALASVDDLVDEIVVVDGPYEWMTPFIDRPDVTRSRDEVYDALAPFQHKLKVHRQVWSDEIQKRRAGYDLCSGRYVLRHDADEVFFPNEAALNQFFRSGLGVAEIDMPIFITPQYRRAREDGFHEHQGALFDRNRIGSAEHLGYLWLVLPKDLQVVAPDPAELFKAPIAFVAHLTGWRTPDTAVNRALFYVMLHARNHDQGMGARLTADGQGAREALLGNSIVSGPLASEGSAIVPAGLDADRIAVLRPLYDRRLQSLAALNCGLSKGRRVRNGYPYSLDVTTAEARAGLGSRFRFSQPLVECGAELATLSAEAPFVERRPLAVRIDDQGDVWVDLPASEGRLQETLVLTPRAASGELITMQVVSDVAAPSPQPVAVGEAQRRASAQTP